MDNCDEICFMIGDETFVCSKSRLVAASDYFKALLLSGFQEASKSQIRLTGVDAKSFALILRWIDSPVAFGRS